MTAYKITKIVILRGGFDIEEMMTKLDAYLAFGRITSEQYKELATLAKEKK